jgi:hypothetical protein
MVHIHDVDQECISRDGGPCYPYETMKETWSVAPGEVLELKLKFTDHLGIYMLHCHILEHEDDGMMTLFEVVPPIVPAGAVSRKVHGASGPYNIALPLTGTPGVESRSGGATNDYEVLVNFTNPVTLDHASVTAGNGSVASTAGGGTTALTINLTGVPNAQTINIKLSSVSDGVTTNDITIPMSILIGDVNGNGAVTASDVSQAKSLSGATAEYSNFRNDVNASGSISATDIGLIKSLTGTTLNP